MYQQEHCNFVSSQHVVIIVCKVSIFFLHKPLYSLHCSGIRLAHVYLRRPSSFHRLLELLLVSFHPQRRSGTRRVRVRL